MDQIPTANFEVTVRFFSYFKDLTGCAETTATIKAGTTLEALLARIHEQFPRLQAMKKSTLAAVGVEYQPGSYVLQRGDEVSLFPPVQGG